MQAINNQIAQGDTWFSKNVVVGYEATVVKKEGKKVGLEMNTDGTLKK